MKRLQRSAIIAITVFAALGFSIYLPRDFWLARMQNFAADRAADEVRSRVKGLPEVDAVEVYSLSREEDPHDPQKFEGDFGVVLKTLDHKTLTGDEAKNIAEVWRKFRVLTGIETQCFEPAYGLQFKQHGRIILKTSLCWECDKFTLPIFPFGEEQYTFDSQSKASKELLRLLEEAVPLPQKPGKTK